jgi:hypothetical protein
MIYLQLAISSFFLFLVLELRTLNLLYARVIPLENTFNPINKFYKGKLRIKGRE